MERLLKLQIAEFTLSCRLFFACCVCLAAAGCTVPDPSSLAIAAQFAQSKGSLVNLETAVPGAWEKVCVLAPYSNDETARKTLGFNWSLEAKTSIATNDGISLLLFVAGNAVIASIEHPRNHGDFSNLAGQCFPKAKAQYVNDPKPANGWPGLFPKPVT